MQALIELAKWFAVVAAGFATMGLMVVGVLAWLLNHPD